MNIYLSIWLSVYFQYDVLHSGLRSMAFRVVWFCFRTWASWNVMSWTWNFRLWIWFDVNVNWFTWWWLSAMHKVNISKSERFHSIDWHTNRKKFCLPDAAAGGVCMSSQCFHVTLTRWQRDWTISKRRMRWMRILMMWTRERCACWIWTTAKTIIIYVICLHESREIIYIYHLWVVFGVGGFILSFICNRLAACLSGCGDGSSCRDAWLGWCDMTAWSSPGPADGGFIYWKGAGPYGWYGYGELNGLCE